MKLLMYILLSLNLVLAVLGWLDVRQERVLPSYYMDPAVDQIQLLGDLSIGKAMDLPDEQCWLIGPLEREQEAEKLRAGLVAVDYFAELVRTELERAPAYWVYFGPIEEYQQSLAQLREFHAKGIDSFIIKKEELSGSISVGVFSNIDSARRMQAIMKRKGYETKMAEIPKTATEFWVSAKVPSEGPLKQSFDAYLQAQKERLETRQIFCN